MVFDENLLTSEQRHYNQNKDGKYLRNMTEIYIVVRS